MGAWWPPRSSTPAWSSNSTRRVRFPSASAISSLKLKGTDKMGRAYVSLIQSNYGRSRHGNFEAVIAHGTELRHLFRDNSRNDFGPWVRGPRITGDHDNVTGAGCIIQSDFGAGPHRNSEAFVPLHLNDGAIELRHFFHDNRDVCLPWTKTQFITQSCAGLGGIIQSSFDCTAISRSSSRSAGAQWCTIGIRTSTSRSPGYELIASTPLTASSACRSRPEGRAADRRVRSGRLEWNRDTEIRF